MSTINFQTKPYKIGEWTILKLPDEASQKLPSRGQVMVKGTINGLKFQTALEPDGRKGHWFKVNDSLRKTAKANAGDTVTLEFESTKDWPEPDIPADLQKALKADPKANTLFMAVTPMARWDWIRWIGATNNPETRKNHIVVAFSKLKAGERRPCCFNRTACTDFSVSKGGQLLEPAQI